MPGVLAIEQVGAHMMRLRVEDAAKGLPAVVDAIGAAGGEVAAAREVRVTFDRVFAELVERANAEDAAADGRAAGAPDAAA